LNGGVQDGGELEAKMEKCNYAVIEVTIPISTRQKIAREVDDVESVVGEGFKPPVSLTSLTEHSLTATENRTKAISPSKKFR
jgi:hypothetical protein